MASWHLAPSLKQLQLELNLRYPGRPADGTIGDASHAARASEHNPDRDSDGMPRGAVSAMDIYTGKVPSSLVSTLIKDPRVWYVIHKRVIYSRTYGFKPRAYTGSNPHNSHIHVSLLQTKAAHDSVLPWLTRVVTTGGITYRVASGDTLSAIALKFRTTVAKLVKWNGIDNPDRIAVGTKLDVDGP